MSCKFVVFRCKSRPGNYLANYIYCMYPCLLSLLLNLRKSLSIEIQMCVWFWWMFVSYSNIRQTRARSCATRKPDLRTVVHRCSTVELFWKKFLISYRSICDIVLVGKLGCFPGNFLDIFRILLVVTASIVYSRHLKRFIALLHMKLIFRRKGRLRFHIYELNMTDM